MKTRIAALTAAAALTLTGCTSSSNALDYEALVADRYADCLELLNISADSLDSVVTGSGNTITGSVFVPLREGVMLEWQLAPNAEHAEPLTVPNEVTTAELEGVGCM